MNQADRRFCRESLGQLFDLEYGAALPDQRRSGDGFPVFGSAGVVGYPRSFLVEGPGIVVGRKGSVGQVRWSDQHFWPIDTAYYVVPKVGTNLRYLFWLLSRIDLKRLDAATGVPGLNRNDVYALRDHVAPLVDQPRIAAVLDTIDAAIAKTSAVIAKLKQVRAGLLHDLLTRGLDDHGQLRDPRQHPEQFQESPLGRIPRYWVVASLVSRVSLPQGQVDPRLPTYRDWTLVAPDHIESGTGRLLMRQTAAEQGAISGKYVVEPNDVVYSKIRPYLCKAILATERGLCSADMYPLRPSEGTSPRFLLAVVLGHTFTRFASAVSMRSGFPKINRTELAEYQLAWPQSDEQHRSAGILESSDEEQAVVERELNKLQKLKSGLMSDLLTGRVRVPEKIAAELAP